MLRTAISYTLLFAALFFLGCSDDNPVRDNHTEQHAEAVGFVIRNSGEEIARYQNGEVSGQIEVGHNKQTALLNVRFLDEAGDLFAPDSDDGFSLGWEIADEAIAEIEQHDEDGLWAFHVAGLTEGETALVIKLNHNGHADFVAKGIAIHVTEDGPGEVHDDEGE